MIKVVLFYAVLVSALAARNWTGSWYVLDQISSNDYICKIPSNHTIVNITADGENLILSGIAAGSGENNTWSLPWNNSQKSASVCINSDWCVMGSIISSKGSTYANISFSGNEDYSTWCSTLLTPNTMTWLGYWYAASSESNTNCPAPKENTLAHIIPDGDELSLLAADSHTGKTTVWSLDFSSQEQHANYCTESVAVCLEAGLGIDNWVMTGQLNWVVDDEYQCNATIIKVPATMVPEELDLLDASLADDLKRMVGF